MEENNILFDICKIKVELLFLNEHFQNIQNYEHNLIFYLNKYLWKIKTLTPTQKNKEEEDSENTSRYSFFEFYTKNLNRKLSNIQETNFLPTKTDFYLNILYILDKKEDFDKNNEKISDIINILSNISIPKEISYLLIICKDNLDLDFITNILDENTYDIISPWDNDKIMKKHKNLENSLKNIVTKYRINALNQKIDIDIKKYYSNDNLNIQKNLKILDAYIKIGNFKKSQEILKEIRTYIQVPKEFSLCNEFNTLIKFLIDYNNDYISRNDNNMIYKKEIESGFLNVIEEYRNINQVYLMINAYIKLLYYLSYFKSINIVIKMNNLVYHLLQEQMEDESKLKLLSNMIFQAYLNISHNFYKIGFKRKFFFYLYKAYKYYYDNYRKNESFGNISYINLLIQNIENYFMKKKTNKVKNYYSYDYDVFLKLSLIIRNSHYNPMYFDYKDSDKKSDYKNKDEEFLYSGPLFITSIFDGLHQVFHHTLWESLQRRIYSDLVKYFQGVKNYDKIILYSLELLQTCYKKLSIDKQTQYLNLIHKKSSKIKYINSYNVVNAPIIIKIIPVRSNLKFEFPQLSIEEEKDDLFIYNPWNKKKENICYYWTLNSIQTIIFYLYNPLNIEVSITQVKLIYRIVEKSKRKYNNSINNDLFNFIPCSIILPPKQIFEYRFKFKPLYEDVFDIIGIEYLLEGVKIKQYIKQDGNGLLFRYINRTESLFNSKLKEEINLHQIKIYPEIPRAKLIPLNNELLDDNPLTLYLFQKFNFNFEIYNKCTKPIKQINIFVYAYKKEDYKINLYQEIIDLNLEYNKKRKFSYDYIHKKNYKHIEFLFYYYFEGEIDENKKKIETKKIMPFLQFKKRLNYKKIFIFSDLNIAPIYSNVNFKKILSLEKNYSNYFTSIISNTFYFSFILQYLNPKKKILYEIYTFNKKENKNMLLDKGKFDLTKIFKLFIDKTVKLRLTYIKWEIIDTKIEGIINCFDLFKNIFTKNLSQIFDFDIIKNVNEDYVEMIYVVTNNDKYSYFNMKLKILVYQEDNKNININIALEEDIFVEGQLIHLIEEIKPSETVKISIKLYPKKDIIFNTTFLLIDQQKNILYIPSFSVNHK